MKSPVEQFTGRRQWIDGQPRSMDMKLKRLRITVWPTPLNCRNEGSEK